MKRITTQQTKTKNSQQRFAELYEHKRDVSINMGCVIDEIRKTARTHDLTLVQGQKRKRVYTLRAHKLENQPGNVDVIDIVETIANCVSRGAANKHVIVPISPEISEDSIFIDFIYNSVWRLIEARYPLALPKDWLIEVSVSKKMINK